MSQATKFYLPFFTTGYPGSKLYTYFTGTNTPAPTYADTAGTLNANPIIMDSKGQAVIYIDRDIIYRYTLRNADNSLIYQQDGIKQLQGDPGLPGGPTGPQGIQGKQGPQGVSGSQGVLGDTGATGDKGLPYITQVAITSNTTLTIPQGISEIYITATGGGGAGANWSPYIYIYDKLDTVNAPYPINAPYKITSSGTTASANTGATYARRRFTSLILLPGSGMSGNSIFRKKIALDSTIVNTVQVFVGSGGLQATADNNGQNGLPTEVYVNTTKVLSLAGGLGGQNFFPKAGGTIPALPSSGLLRLNRGFKNGLLYFQNNGTQNFQILTTGQSNFIWPTTYKQVSGATYVNKDIQLSYWCPLQTLGGSSVAYAAFTSHSVERLEGDGNIFGNYYTQLQTANELGSPLNIATASKSGSIRQGWGAGGDVFFNGQSKQSYFADYYVSAGMMSNNGGDIPANFVTYDKTYIKSRIIAYMNGFTVSDSYAPGVASVPALTDTGGVWTGVDNIGALVAGDPTNYMVYSGPGFYNAPSIRKNFMAPNAGSQGGIGVNGFALIEYGNITEVTA